MMEYCEEEYSMQHTEYGIARKQTPNVKKQKVNNNGNHRDRTEHV